MLNGFSAEIFFGEDSKLLSEERREEIFNAELFSAGEREDGFVIFVNECFPSGTYNIEIPRSGVDVSVDGFVNGCIPFVFINISMSEVANHLCSGKLNHFFVDILPAFPWRHFA